MVKVGTKFHDGYDRITATWKVVNALGNDKWLCRIQNKEFSQVTDVYSGDFIQMIIDSEKSINAKSLCKTCGEPCAGRYEYCVECEIDMVMA